jgi:hypothetical protein
MASCAIGGIIGEHPGGGQIGGSGIMMPSARAGLGINVIAINIIIDKTSIRFFIFSSWEWNF